MMDIFEEISEYVNTVNFTKRSIHINYKYRTIYQVCRITLILGIATSASGSSLLKIQVLSSALDNEKLFDQLEMLVKGNQLGFIRGWKFNKMVSRAVSYCNAEGITQITSTGKLILAEKGIELYQQIILDESLLTYEKEQLLKIKKKLSETMLMRLLERGL